MPTFLLIPLLLLVDGVHFVFARLLLPHSDPSSSVLFVLGLATLEVGIYGFATKQIKFKMLRKNAWLFLAIGFVVAISAAINYRVVEIIDPGIASLLAQTGTLWAVLFGLFWLREHITPAQVGGILLALLGVFIINFNAGNYFQIGSLLLILSSALYAFHSALAKKFGDQIDLVNFFFGRLLATTFFLGVIAIFTPTFEWPKVTAWPFIALAATVDVAISRALYYLSLRKLKLTILTIILTLSPITSILWSLVLFKSKMNTQQIVGGAIVLGAVLLVGLTQRNKKNT